MSALATLGAIEVSPCACVQDALDEEEQERHIASLELHVARHMRRNKALLGGAALLLAVMYCGFAVHQAVAPWQLLLHAELQGADMTSGAVIVGLLGGALTVGVGAAAVVTFGPAADGVTWRKMLNLSVTMAALEALFWGTAILKVCMQPGHNWWRAWRVAWLPLTPALWVAAVVVVINGIGNIPAQFDALRAARYPLKRA